MAKRAAVALTLGLLLAACSDDSGTPSAPSAPAPPPVVAPAPAPNPITPPSGLDEPPVLRFSIRPEQPSGPLPRDVTANMCGSTDPEGETLIYEYKWGGTGGEHFSYFCRLTHTYTEPGNYRAFFCVHDDHDHRVCFNQRIDITP